MKMSAAPISFAGSFLGEVRSAHQHICRLYQGIVASCRIVAIFFSVVVPTLIPIVDDDQSVREGLQRLLSSVGFAVNTFASADEYSGSDRAKSADCLLLDIRMPGKGGIELHRQVAANHSEIPVIFITAPEEETARVQTLDGNARTVFIKPFSEEVLLNAINHMLSAKSERTEDAF
jgi:FixJ family two-component response regulator